jgi:hypothetical protein
MRALIVTTAAMVCVCFVGCGGSTAPTPVTPSPTFSSTTQPTLSSPFAIAAVDLAACLRSSQEPACFSGTRLISRAVGAAATAPGAPANLVATVSGTSVTLAWSAPASGDPVITYLLEAGSSSGAANLANIATNNATTTFLATGVPAGTYFVRVRAQNTGGISPASNEAVVIVSAGACTSAPDAPTGLTSNVSGTTVTLTWGAPAGGCPPTSYILQAGSSSGSSNLANLTTGSLSTLYVAPGVPAGTYYVRVRAANAVGTSGASNEVVIAVAGSPGGNPSMSATIDGVAWTAATITSNVANGRLSIIGSTPTVYSLIISLLPPGPGTFPITSAGPSFATLTSSMNLQPGRPVPQWQTQSGGPGIGGGSGSVTVSTFTATGASGTFFFTLGPYLLTGATGNKEVTAGVFNVRF